MQKHFCRFCLIAILSPGLPSIAQAGPVTIGSFAQRAPDVIRSTHVQTLQALWSASQKQQALDGGTLTPEHLAKFQRRLNRANDDYRRELVNNNPLTVDADGHPNKMPSNIDWTWSDLARVGTEN